MKLNDYDIPDDPREVPGEFRFELKPLEQSMMADSISYQIKYFEDLRKYAREAIKDQNDKWDRFGDNAYSDKLRKFGIMHAETIFSVIKKDRLSLKYEPIRIIYEYVSLFIKRSYYVISQYKKKLKKLREELLIYEETTFRKNNYSE